MKPPLKIGSVQYFDNEKPRVRTYHFHYPWKCPFGHSHLRHRCACWTVGRCQYCTAYSDCTKRSVLEVFWFTYHNVLKTGSLSDWKAIDQHWSNGSWARVFLTLPMNTCTNINRHGSEIDNKVSNLSEEVILIMLLILIIAYEAIRRDKPGLCTNWHQYWYRGLHQWRPFLGSWRLPSK